MSHIGDQVARKIKDKRWSIVTTASRSGVPIATLKSIIYGYANEPKVQVLEKLANVFDCNISDLVGANQVDNCNVAVDLALFEECHHALEAYVERHGEVAKDKKMQAIDYLMSLFAKKKAKNMTYQIDDDVIEWILDNL